MKQSKPTTIAERIRRRREDLGMARERLALQWNVALSTIRNWEIGLSEPRGAALVMVEKWLAERSAK